MNYYPLEPSNKVQVEMPGKEVFIGLCVPEDLNEILSDEILVLKQRKEIEENDKLVDTICSNLNTNFDSYDRDILEFSPLKIDDESDNEEEEPVITKMESRQVSLEIEDYTATMDEEEEEMDHRSYCILCCLNATVPKQRQHRGMFLCFFYIYSFVFNENFFCSKCHRKHNET